MIDHDGLVELFSKLYGADKEVAAATRTYLVDNMDVILPDLETFLNQALDNRILEHQSLTIWVIGEMPSSRSVDILLKTMGDERFNRRAYFVLIHSLARSDDERVIPILLEIVGGPGSPELETAHDGLSRFGEAAIPKFVELFHSGNTYIRRGAVERLGSYPLHPLALPTLLEATHDADAIIRENTVGSLSRFRYPEALIRLLGLLRVPDKRLRARVFTSLILIDPYTALTRFMELLKDTDPAIREEAAEILISRPVEYFGLGGWLSQQNLSQFYKDAPGFEDVKGLASSSDIKALLEDTEVIYGTRRVCDITSGVLKAIGTPLTQALLTTGLNLRR